MFITELIREFLFDCKVRELSDLTVKNYEKQLQKFRHFVRENFQVIQFEELKPIHVKEYISSLQDRGCKIDVIMRIFKSFAAGTKDGGFEKFCQAFLTKLGYECEITKESNDGGIDIIAIKDGTTIGFQCKNRESNVGSPIIRETEGAKTARGLDKCAILTTSTFTKDAKEEAEKLGIELFNWSSIAKLTADMEFEDTEEDRKLLSESVIFEHNEEVYDQLEKFLSEDNKTHVFIELCECGSFFEYNTNPKL